MVPQRHVDALLDFAVSHPDGWMYDDDIVNEFGWSRAWYSAILRELRLQLQEQGWNIYCYRSVRGLDGIRSGLYILTNDVVMQRRHYFSVWNKDMRTRLSSGTALTRSATIAAQGQGDDVRMFARLMFDHVRLEHEAFANMMDVLPNHQAI